MLKKEGCFFNVVLSEICMRFSDKTKTRPWCASWRGVAGVVGFREESKFGHEICFVTKSECL